MKPPIALLARHGETGDAQVPDCPTPCRWGEPDRRRSGSPTERIAARVDSRSGVPQSSTLPMTTESPAGAWACAVGVSATVIAVASAARVAFRFIRHSVRQSRVRDLPRGLHPWPGGVQAGGRSGTDRRSGCRCTRARTTRSKPWGCGSSDRALSLAPRATPAPNAAAECLDADAGTPNRARRTGRQAHADTSLQASAASAACDAPGPAAQASGSPTPSPRTDGPTAAVTAPAAAAPPTSPHPT